MIILTFSKSSVVKSGFHPHENEKLLFSNSSGLKSVYEELRIRDGYSVEGRTPIEIKLRF